MARRDVASSRFQQQHGWQGTRSLGFFYVPNSVNMSNWHSMGAAQAIGQVEQCPGIARSCTILGGGRAISKPSAWVDLAVFAAAGDVDFGRRGAIAFAESAKKANAEVEQRIYENVEHLAIVQVSLTDIFDWLKKLPQKILPTQ